ncbi:MAG TPA: PH domain-containing protein [Solirubrobacteraceae bacterium]|nr:PH domain-containing protein [Solirubrobacteraceae bacterium]
MTPEPTRTLAREARWVWRGEQLFGWGVAVVVGMLVAAQLDGALALALRIVPAVCLLAFVALVPSLRWRHWRWEVRPEAIDIRHGTFTIRRTLVPMLRVQHVDSVRGVVEQSLDLATVVVHTAAGSHKIPMLSVKDAAEVRDRIAGLARTDEP